jgi:hypothetical protein
VVVAASYSQNDFIKSFLSLRKVVASYEQQRINAAKYDTPCSSIDKNIAKAQYLLWAMQNMECFTLEEKYKVISKANRVAKNCAFCPGVSETEINEFVLSEEGRSIIWQSNLPEGLLLYNDLTYLVYYENGLPYLIEI